MGGGLPSSRGVGPRKSPGALRVGLPLPWSGCLCAESLRMTSLTTHQPTVPPTSDAKSLQTRRGQLTVALCSPGGPQVKETRHPRPPVPAQHPPCTLTPTRPDSCPAVAPVTSSGRELMVSSPGVPPQARAVPAPPGFLSLQHSVGVRHAHPWNKGTQERWSSRAPRPGTGCPSGVHPARLWEALQTPGEAWTAPLLSVNRTRHFQGAGGTQDTGTEIQGGPLGPPPAEPPCGPSPAQGLCVSAANL